MQGGRQVIAKRLNRQYGTGPHPISVCIYQGTVTEYIILFHTLHEMTWTKTKSRDFGIGGGLAKIFKIKKWGVGNKLREVGKILEN